MTLALLLLAVQTPAVLEGQVTDAVTGAPVVRAVVTAGNLEAFTGADGRFVVRALAPGRYEVRVRRLGFTPRLAEVVVANGAETRVDLTLVPLPVALSPVAATGSSSAAATLRHAALTARGLTLAEALDGWQGVTVVRRGTGPAAPTVRGSLPSEVLVLVDGAPLNDPFTGVADLRRIGTRDVAQVSVYPGAQAARFGARALSGVIAIETLGRVGTGGGGGGWVGSYGAAGGRLSLPFASVEMERGPDGFPVSLPANRGGAGAIRRNAVARELRGQARWGILAVQAYGSRRGLPGTLSNPTPAARAEDRWGQAALRWRGLRLSGDWFDAHAQDSAPPAGLVSYDSRVTVRGGEASYGFALGPAILETGARVDRFTGDIAGGSATTRRAHVALYTERELARFMIAPTARFDLWNGAGGPALSLRADAAWRFRALRVSLSAGSSASPPVPADLIFHEGVGVRPNPALRPERVPFEVEGGLALEAPLAGSEARVFASLRGFDGRVKDYVVWAPDFRFIWSPRNFEVRRRGVESSVQVRWPGAGLEAEGAAAVQRITYDYPDAPQVIYRPKDAESLRLAWQRGAWLATLGWKRLGARFPFPGGANPLAPVATWAVGLRARASLGARALSAQLDLTDLTDQRPSFIFDFPSPGRSLILRCEITTP